MTVSREMNGGSAGSGPPPTEDAAFGSGLTPLELLKRRLLFGGAWASVGKVATVLLVLAINAVLARLLAPDELGAYFLTFSLVSVFAVVAQLGLNQAVVRLVSESLGTGRPGRARSSVSIVLRFGLLGSVFIAGVLYGGGGSWMAEHVFGSPLMERTVGLAALWVVALALQGLLSETFRGWHDIRSATLFGGLITGLLSAIVFSAIWVVRGHSDLSEVLAVSIVAGASSSVAAGILLKQKIMPLKGTDRIRPREVLEIAWPLLLTNVVYFGLNQGDLLILGAFRSSEEVALYGAAVQVVTLVSFPLIIVNAVVPPLIAELYARGEKSRLERTLRTTATAAGIPALVVAAALILFGGPILGVVYGNYYADGYFVVAALGLGYLINVLFGSCGNTLIMTGHHYTMLAITVLTGAVTIGGMFWVVGRYGMPAVAVVSSARIILQNFLMWIYAWKKTGVWTHANFRPSAIRGFLQTTE